MIMDNQVHSGLDNVLSCLSENGYTISSLISDILMRCYTLEHWRVRLAREELERDAVDICARFLRHIPTTVPVTTWALQIVQSALWSEVEKLTKIVHGLHFDARAATTEQIELSFMPQLADKMCQVAPSLWSLVFSLLGALDERRLSLTVDPISMNLAEIFKESERVLEEIGGDMEVEGGQGEDGDDNDSDPCSDLESEEDMPCREKSWKDVSSRNTAIQVIKCVICTSIILQSANENCNHLQSILGIFVHSANVPQRVTEVLAHAGITISIKSIQRAVKSMSVDSARKIKEGLRSLKMAIAYNNFDINFKTLEPTVAHQSSFVSATSATAIPLIGMDNVDVLRCSEALWTSNTGSDEFDLLKFHVTNTYDHIVPGTDFSPQRKALAWHLGVPETVFRIPVSKTDQVPMRSMRIKQSSVDGNVEVMDNLLRQGGLGGPTEPDFGSNGDVDISEFVLLVHGDLLTKERLDTIQDSRRIEDTPKNRFQFVVFILGLFHFKMACVDALWRTYLQVKEGREDETGLMVTKPGFRRMHDVVHYELRAAILECWREEASIQASADSVSLKVFAETRPDWELITKMSEDIVRKYVATMEGLPKPRAKPESERDQQFENQALRNRDYLLYVDLCNAINVGDVGRVEASFLHWIYMFSGTGKHKYASQLARFLKNLHEVYPPNLSSRGMTEILADSSE
ncbi:hypothetical protein EDB85DRAFT_1888141 [Lactarius pseudohatsudake]|nr:hypothetical protein EDB85DRAFT_1888141 [Lactarius pseudohatsudake]